MSTCISRHGEYSDHALAAEGNAVERFVCERCFAIAEDDLFTSYDALLAEVEKLRAERDAAKRSVSELLADCDACVSCEGETLSPDGFCARCELGDLEEERDRLTAENAELRAANGRISAAWGEVIQREESSDNAHLHDMEQLRAECDRVVQRVRDELHLDDDAPVNPPDDAPAEYVAGWDDALGWAWDRLRAALDDKETG